MREPRSWEVKFTHWAMMRICSRKPEAELSNLQVCQNNVGN